ncbi:S-layer homology domain-containing protein [Paenibacillus sp. IB182496]|uniref:S-layer homology domain-containing protein n=1 Tax=Paenibacillus sabuli TaxID=2772509 RepID=A0A927BVR5_9BACL|nr:S-layer homology domain-containing protein [Paenibacillus sabuli]MBD2846248.1 S-layer homology domain-containing protein [Paenibacillus sabuli]
MQKKRLAGVLVSALLLLALGQSAFAFPDTANDPNAEQIKKLEALGIVKGGNDGSFRPGAALSYAEGLTLIVRGLELTTGDGAAGQAPASNAMNGPASGAWYADALAAAQASGIDLPEEVGFGEAMTREAFAHALFQGIAAKGDYAFIEMWVMIEDEAQIDSAYMNSIQKLILAKIAALDENGAFHPTASITRSEAAGWLFGAVSFVEEVEPIPPLEPEPANSPLQDISFAISEAGAGVNQVVVSATAPHPGYGMRIAGIDFHDDTAVLRVEVTLPDPDRMYPQVITELETVTYVDSDYSIELEALAPAAQSQAGNPGPPDADAAIASSTAAVE